MKRLLLAVLMVVFLCAGASCTVVFSPGTIVGIDGTPLNGSITLSLPFAAVNTTNNQLVTGSPVRFPIINGAITGATVPGSDILSPVMTYRAEYRDTYGSLVRIVRYYITGNTFDVGTANAIPDFINLQNVITNPLSSSACLSWGSIGFTAPDVFLCRNNVTFNSVSVGTVAGGVDGILTLTGLNFPTTTGSILFFTDTSITRKAFTPGWVRIGNGSSNSLGSLEATGLSILGNATMKRIQVIGAAPTCASTGGGAGATCTISAGSTDSGGAMTINTGTGPAALGTVTLTFSSAFGSAGTICPATLSNNGANWNTRASIIGGAGSTASVSWNWDNNAVALTASTASAYSFVYWCSAR